MEEPVPTPAEAEFLAAHGWQRALLPRGHARAVHIKFRPQAVLHGGQVDPASQCPCRTDRKPHVPAPRRGFAPESVALLPQKHPPHFGQDDTVQDLVLQPDSGGDGEGRGHAQCRAHDGPVVVYQTAVEPLGRPHHSGHGLHRSGHRDALDMVTVARGIADVVRLHVPDGSEARTGKVVPSQR